MFSSVNNSKTISKIMTDIFVSKGILLLWDLNGKEKLADIVTIKRIRKSEDEIILSYGEGSKENVLKIISHKKYCNLMLEDEGLIFQLQIIKTRESEIICSLPRIIAQINRRSENRRQGLDASLKLFVETNNSLGTMRLSKECFDISSGGAALILNVSEANYFEVGDIIPIKLTLMGQVIGCDVEVRSLREIRPDTNNNLMYSGFKLSLKFLALSESHEQMLLTYLKG